MISKIKGLIIEILKTVGPVILAVIILQFTIIKMPLISFLRFLLGAIMVIIGLLFFTKGIKIGLDPLGELVGGEVPKKGSALIVMIVAFIIGVAVAVAEPNVRVLSHQVDAVSGRPYKQKRFGASNCCGCWDICKHSYVKNHKRGADNLSSCCRLSSYFYFIIFYIRKFYSCGI